MTTPLIPRTPAPTRTAAAAWRDCLTMTRRQLRHLLRYPSLTLMIVGMPTVFLLLFVFVLGGALGTGIAGAGATRTDYATYVTPGILAMAVGTAVTGTALSMATDMTEGIVARFRTMAIFRPALLTGHVLGALVQTMLAVVVVAAVAVAVGFRPTGDPAGWLAALGVLAAFTFALTWLGVALGVRADSVETASNTPTPLMLLPFLGSGFVPTDSLPVGLRQFAEWQPFTPVIESVRAGLTGVPMGGYAPAALAWCAGIAALSYLWSMRAYNRT